MNDKSARRIYGIIGGSLRHSLSPIIHNHFFKKLAPGNIYTKFETNQSSLEDIMRGMKSLGIAGANVTFPHKEEIIRYLDRLDKTAEMAGAVNIIKNVKGQLVGYNTDTAGISATIIDRMKFNPRGKFVIILGAGGAARACLQVLIKEKTKRIIIVNRNIKNAEKMIRRIKSGKTGPEIDLRKLNEIELTKNNHRFDLLVNATSASVGTIRKVLWSLHRYHYLNATWFFDMNYGGRAFGGRLPKGISKFEDGLYMLAAQAAASFKIWTGIGLETASVFRFLKRESERDL